MGRDDARRFEAERRWAQEELERDAETVERRRRTLADILRDAAVDGSTIGVVVGGRTFEGEAVHAAGDLFTIAVGDAEVDVRLSAAGDIRVRGNHVRTQPRVLARHPGSFLGRLNEANALEIAVELGGAGIAATPACRVAVVAADHVELDGPDGSRLVPIDAISYLVRRPGDRRRDDR